MKKLLLFFCLLMAVFESYSQDTLLNKYTKPNNTHGTILNRVYTPFALTPALDTLQDAPQGSIAFKNHIMFFKDTTWKIWTGSSGNIAYLNGWGLALSGNTFRVDSTLVPTISYADNRFYTKSQINAFFSGVTSISGYNKANWDAVYSAYAAVQALSPAGWATQSALVDSANNLRASIMAGSGIGDMTKAVYDANNNGIVDDLEVTGVVIGNGTSAPTSIAGTANQLLRRNAANTAYEFFTPSYLTSVDTTNISNFSVKARSLFSATDPLSYNNGIYSLRQSFIDSTRHTVYSLGIGGSGGKGTITATQWNGTTIAGSFLTGGWVSSPTAGQILMFDGSHNDWINTTLDTTGISNFSVKVKSLFSATAPVTYSNGKIALDTSTGKWRSEAYLDTKYQPIGSYLTSVPGLQSVLNASSYLSDASSVLLGNTFYIGAPPEITGIGEVNLNIQPSAGEIDLTANGIQGRIEMISTDADNIQQSKITSNYSEITLSNYLVGSTTYKSDVVILKDSILLKPYQGKLNIDSLRSWNTIADTTYKKIMTWDKRNGKWEFLDLWPAFGTGGGTTNIYNDTTFYQRITYSGKVHGNGYLITFDSSQIRFRDTLTSGTGKLYGGIYDFNRGKADLLTYDSVVASNILQSATAGIKLRVNDYNNLDTNNYVWVKPNKIDVVGNALSFQVTDSMTISGSGIGVGSSVDSFLVMTNSGRVKKYMPSLSGYELLSNKAVNFSTVNDTKYPTVKAVADYLAANYVAVTDSTNLFVGGNGLYKDGDTLKLHLVSATDSGAATPGMKINWDAAYTFSQTFTLTSPSNGSVIKYNSTSGKWEVGTDNTGGGGVTDGDKGSITVSSSGTVWTIDAGAVTNSMLAGSIAYSKLSISGAITNSDLAGSISISKLSITGTPTGAKFLRDDGSWQTVSATLTDNGYSTDLTKTKLLITDTTTGLIYHTDFVKAKFTNRADNDMYLDSAGYTVNRTASQIRTVLGLVIGTNVQAYDADLTTYAGITPSANIQTFLGSADFAAMRSNLGLVIGTNVQAYDADLTTYAGITPSANVQTLLGASNYAAFKTSLSLNNVENTALSTWAGTANITTLGTIATGVWHGTAIADTYISSASTWNGKQDGDADLTAIAALSGTNTIYYRSAANTWSAVTIGSNLTFSGGTLNASGGWSQPSLAQYHFLYSSNGSTITDAGNNLTFDGSTFTANAKVKAKTREFDETSAQTSASTAATIMTVPISDSYAAGHIEFIANGYDGTSNDAATIKVKCDYKMVAGTLTIRGSGTIDYALNGTLVSAAATITTSGTNILLQVNPGTTNIVYWQINSDHTKIIPAL